MPVEFTEQQVKSMNKREMARHNFKAYLLDSLYALKNGTTASFETVFTKSTVNHERFRSDLTIKNADGNCMRRDMDTTRNLPNRLRLGTYFVNCLIFS